MNQGCDMCGQPATKVSVSGHSCESHWAGIEAFAKKAKLAAPLPDVKRVYRLPFGALLTVRRSPLRIELLLRSNENEFQRQRAESKLMRQKARAAL